MEPITTPIQESSDPKSLAWEFAAEFEFTSWELKGCPSSKMVQNTLDGAEAYAASLLELAEREDLFNRVNVEKLDWSNDGIAREILAESLRGTRRAAADIMVKGAWVNDPAARNRFCLMGGIRTAFLKKNFVPFLVATRLLDLALIVMDRVLHAVHDPVAKLLENARCWDRAASCEVVNGRKLNGSSGHLNPFINHPDDLLKSWYQTFALPFLEAAIDGRSPFEGTRRGSPAPLALLIRAIYWREPGWLKGVRRQEWLSTAQGFDNEDIWSVNPSLLALSSDSPCDYVHPELNSDLEKEFRQTINSYIKVLASRKAPPKKLPDSIQRWVKLPQMAAWFANPSAVHSDIPKAAAPFPKLELISSIRTKVVARLTALHDALGRPLSGRQEAIALDSFAVSIAGIRQPKNACRLRDNLAAWINGGMREVATRAEEVDGVALTSHNRIAKGSRGMGNSWFARLAAASPPRHRPNFKNQALLIDQVRRCITAGSIHQTERNSMMSSDLRSAVTDVVGQLTSEYRHRLVLDQLTVELGNLSAKQVEKPSVGKQQAKYRRELTASFRVLADKAGVAGVELPPLTGPLGSQIAGLLLAIERQVLKYPLSIDALDLLLTYAEAEIAEISGLIQLWDHTLQVRRSA